MALKKRLTQVIEKKKQIYRTFAILKQLRKKQTERRPKPVDSFDTRVLLDGKSLLRPLRPENVNAMTIDESVPGKYFQ